jgi:hypothetical protein
LDNLSCEELCAIYDSYTQRFVSDNSNIWTANAIFTPAAFAALAVHFTVGDQNFWEFVSLFIASIGLAVASLVIAEKHKMFQTISLIEMRAVELRLADSADFGKAMPPARNIAERLAKTVGIGRTRRMLVWFLLASWVAAALSSMTNAK